jgi:preprotein translocase subunit SecG
MILIIVIHVIVCLGLIGIVLIQRGRGGGLVESFAGVESMFGTKTSTFLTRATTVLSIIFFITCLSLAVLSIKQSQSLMRNVVVPEARTVETTPAVTPATAATQATPATPATAATQTTATEPAKEDSTAGAHAPFTQTEEEVFPQVQTTQQEQIQPTPKANKTEGAPQTK